MEVIDVVNKLVGPIDPVGAEHIDKDRFENLKYMCDMVGELVNQIAEVASDNSDRHEDSMRKAGLHARNFLGGLIF